MGSCRAATITGTLSRISLNDEEEEKGPEGLNYSTLPGNIMSKVLIQQPSGLHMSMGVGDLGDQCMDSTADMRRTVYLCTDDATRQSEQELSAHDLSGHPQPGQMETDYIVLPRSSAAVSASGSSSVPTLIFCVVFFIKVCIWCFLFNSLTHITFILFSLLLRNMHLWLVIFAYFVLSMLIEKLSISLPPSSNYL